MYNAEYKKKLDNFNATDKYKMEKEFLYSLMQPVKGEKILDYGCGTGKMVIEMNERFNCDCYGYDQNDLLEQKNEYLFRKEFFFPFDKIFLMHSIAHVQKTIPTIEKLKGDFLKPGGKIFVVTPNAYWIDGHPPHDYKADHTVIKHFYPTELKEVFESVGLKVYVSGEFGQIIGEAHERLFLIAAKQ